MKKQLALVLGGGGGRGALQVGALRAIVEAGIQPDILTGTSIGAVNAAFVALNGFNLSSVATLYKTWLEAIYADPLPSNYMWLTIRTLFNRNEGQIPSKMFEFLTARGLTPGLTFQDIRGVKLYIISADLNHGQPVIYGLDPKQSLLEAALASATLPPWIRTVEKDGRLLLDGGAVSNLPIEPAIAQGATEIIALDLSDPRELSGEAHGFGPFLNKLIQTVQTRETNLELQLAEARRIPVLHIQLRGKKPVSLWDFTHSEELMLSGYEITKTALTQWQPRRYKWWTAWLKSK